MGHVDWSSVVCAGETHSWEECLKKGEHLGGPSVWGNSKWQDFKVCPYRYWWKHIKKKKPVEKDPNLEIGGLLHEAMARYHTAPLASAKEEGYSIINRAEAIVPAVAGEARRLFNAYMVLRGPGTPLCDHHRTGGIEEELVVQEPFPYSARLDRWIHDDQGHPVIVEYKTTARKDAHLLSSYRMDSQFIGQQYLWNRLRKDKLAGFKVVLLTKTAQVQVSSELVNVNQKLIKDWEKEMKWHYQLMTQCQMLNQWPRRRTYSCRYCPLFDHCATLGKNVDGWL